MALLSGCMAWLTRLMLLGVTARLTARPGCVARRTLRGIRSRVRKLTWVTIDLAQGAAFSPDRSRYTIAAAF